MNKAKINSIEKVRHQATNTEFLDVAFDVVDAEGAVLESKRIGLSVNASKEDVVREVNGHVEEYGRALENKRVDAEREAANANVRDMQENLVGATVEPSQPVEGDGEEN